MTGGLSVTKWQSVRRLLHSRGREESGRLLVEGHRAVRSVLGASTPPEFLLVGPNSASELEALENLPLPSRVPVFAITDKQAKELAGTAHSQEIFAVLPWRPNVGVPTVLPDLMLHLSGIRNPLNMGAMLRTASAFGIAVTCSPDCVDVTHPEAVRGGAGSYFSLPLYVDLPLELLRSRCPHQVVYASSKGGADLSGWAWPERAILVLGGEAVGATESMKGALAVHIPIHVESLNAAVAGGIMMWSAKRGVHTA